MKLKVVILQQLKVVTLHQCRQLCMKFLSEIESGSAMKRKSPTLPPRGRLYAEVAMNPAFCPKNQQLMGKKGAQEAAWQRQAQRSPLDGATPRQKLQCLDDFGY